MHLLCHCLSVIPNYVFLSIQMCTVLFIFATFQKCGVSKIFEKKVLLLFSKDIEKSDSKDAYNKISISNKLCSFELSIHQRILKKLCHSF